LLCDVDSTCAWGGVGASCWHSGSGGCACSAVQGWPRLKSPKKCKKSQCWDERLSWPARR
jgi:hypothetical protein